MKVGDLVEPHLNVVPWLQGAKWSGIVIAQAESSPDRWVIMWTITKTSGEVLQQYGAQSQRDLEIISEINE
jgi:hypothetical protein